ncbi:hypothetical protein DCO48_10430 [Pseudomonas sp. SDI]|uniref:hypothetical protein n=1 Tax=Pseudomonas sp. SDI TaxID=2170734 RepID=UPI000DE70CD6|nr:hypothetical protein [Pseudomonas sp. SDI]PWB33375.1 hypothetical protein DCO48_10430 [Pseudomonas sp. SDI]
MGNPFDKACATAPPTLGEGCLSRYDPEALSSDDGTEFPGAAALWQQLSAPHQAALADADAQARQPAAIQAQAAEAT